MSLRRVAAFAAFAVVGGVLATGGGAGAQALPPVEAFGQLPFLSQPQLSPDGKHFAGLQSLDGKPAAVIYTVNSPDPPQVFASTDWIITDVRWAKNDRLAMFTKTIRAYPLGADPELYTWYRVLSLEVGGSNWVQLFGNNIDSNAVNLGTGIVDSDLGDPNIVLMPLWTRPADSRIDNDASERNAGDFREYRYSLYKVDIHTGHAAVLQDGAMLPGHWITDGEGNIVGRVDQTRSPLTDHLSLYNDGSWHHVRDFDAREDRGANVEGLSFDAKSLVIAALNGAGRNALVRLDRDSGATGAALFDDPAYDVAEVLTDDWTGRVIGAGWLKDKMEYVYFDPAREALQRGIEQVFPGLDAHAVSVTQAGDKAIVAVEAPTQPRTFYFLDRDTHKATMIASEYPGLKASDLGQMQPYPFKARDGLDIPAYLTLPPGRSGKNLPLVVMPHGGPDARDRMQFDWWVQFLANRGYAVFQPNFRGSTGYGHAFDAAGFHQWGLKMQDDISDGVKKLIADGVVDPKRICIVGASYGGYAALAGATFTPELYACAASFAGVSDLGGMMAMETRRNGSNSQTLSFWTSRIGSASDDSVRLDATSPAQHAGQVRAPILLMHGKLDTTVPFLQSEEERDALTRAGKKVEFVAMEGDDHYLSLAETRIQMLRTLEAFLKENIGQ
ncbi:MAG TPA: S9 family peptidase [Rhizomicrobium sp.]|jgi:dipeptidyl aminopeptidase/acylaminoacyl peptidase|nr:S9 family peptidase [Rhizomicrobium sp.]